MNITDLAEGDATARYLTAELTHQITPEAMVDAHALVDDALDFERPPAGAHVVAARLAELAGDVDAFEDGTSAALLVDPSFGPALDDLAFVELLTTGPGKRAGARRRALHLFDKLDWYSGRATELTAQFDLATGALGVDDPMTHGSECLLIAESGLFLAFLAFEASMLERFDATWGRRLPPAEQELLRSWRGCRHRRFRVVSAGRVRSRLTDVATGEVLDVEVPFADEGWEPGEEAFALVVPVGSRWVLIGEPMIVDEQHAAMADAAAARLGDDPLAVAHLCLRWLYVEQLQIGLDDLYDRIAFVFPDVDPATVEIDEDAIYQLVRDRHAEAAARADAGDAMAEMELLLEAIVAERIITLRTPHTWALAQLLLAQGGTRESALEAVRDATYAELWDRGQGTAA